MKNGGLRPPFSGSLPSEAQRLSIGTKSRCVAPV